MTKYNKLLMMGGSTLVGLFIFIISLVYFSLTREVLQKPSQKQSDKRDTVLIEKIIKLPADTIFIVKNCTKKHCSHLEVKPESQEPDTSTKIK